MSLLQPKLPDYDPIAWAQLPFPERARLVCQSWAIQGYGTPIAVYVAYLLKIGFYVGVWLAWCARSPALGMPSELGTWWAHPLAFQKAVVWSLLFEVLGLGCGSGPLSGRYSPPVGGPLYFMRPGTLTSPPFPKLPLLGRARRSWLDVGLYAGLVVACCAALWAPTDGELGLVQLLPIALILPILGLSDRTVFFAARSEHYLVLVVVFALATGPNNTPAQWIAGAMAVHAALWFFAGFSKLNHHFEAVVCVMVSNSPVLRWPWLRKRMYRAYPDDLRPSSLAKLMGHAGTALEMGLPVLLLLAGDGPLLVAGMVGVLLLHGFITSNVPMGVPLEWNLLVVYGAFALFWAHPEVSVLDMSLPIAILVCTTALAVPVLGNLFPARVPFLAAMRYYAGNWAMSIWLLRDRDDRKIRAGLTMPAPWIYDQLEGSYPYYSHETAVALLGKVMAFRLMHLHGRAIGKLLPKTIDAPLNEYIWLDGELVAGLTLGWNFGDGHLHDEALLAAIAESGEFEEGDLRCIFIEAQPMGGSSLHYRIHDAHSGLREEGQLEVSELRERQPWDLG